MESYHQRLEASKARELDLEYYESVDTRIYCPSPLDVLRGRGKPFQEHSGNVRLAKLIETHLDVYRTTKRGGKSEVSEDILQFVREYNGRFVEKQEGEDEWKVVDDDEAREKVSQGFRNAFKKGALPPIPILQSHSSSSYDGIIERDTKRIKVCCDESTCS